MSCFKPEQEKFLHHRRRFKTHNQPRNL